MPVASKTLHRTFDDLALPYVTNSSPISTDPQLVGGQNCLTSLRGILERRPGFARAIENAATAFQNCVRMYVWRRWDDPSSGATRGAYFVMFCDIRGATSKVYKLQLGTDSSAVLIHTDSLSANPFEFVVSNNQCYFGNGTSGNMKRYDGTTVYNWGIVAPASAPGLSVNGTGISAAVSYCYLTTFGYGTGTGSTAISIGESSPGPISACSGVFTNKTVSLTLTPSADAQVNQIHVYRTTDGGSQDPSQMREITGSPFSNANQVVTDTTLDVNLGIIPAPPALRNDPPPPSVPKAVYGGRIWLMAQNTVYYTGFEEIGRGVPEECVPGGLDGNYYPYESEVNNLAPLPDGVAVFLAQRIGKIEGESLDTFRRYTLLEKRGTRSRTAVTSLGGSVAWLDTSSTIWLSDAGEIGLPIRPDTASLDPAKCFLAIHISGSNHWLLVLDGANGKIFPYDLDRKQWMTPWIVGTTASCMISAETAVGTVDLLIARNGTKALKLTPTQYNDDGNLYSSFVNSNQFHISPEQNKSWKGVVDWIEWKQNTVTPSAVKQLTDDHPTSGTFVDLTGNIADTPDITQGTAILTKRATSNSPTAQLATVRFEWPAEDANFQMYELDVASHPVGT